MQKEEFNAKESQRCNVSVQRNHHQDKEKRYLVILNQRWMFNKMQNKEKILYIQRNG